MNVVDTLLLIGALHGFVMSGLLWRQSSKKQLNRLLAGIVFILGLENWGTYCFTTGLVSQNILFYLSSFSFILALGPLLYGYTYCLTRGEIVWQKRHLLHLAPLLIQVVNYQSFFLFNPTLPWIDESLWKISMTAKQYATAVSVFVYVYWCQRLIRKSADSIATGSSARHLIFLTRIYWGLLTVNVIWSIYLGLKLMNAAPMMAFAFYSLHTLLSVLIYWLAIEGYLLHREPTQSPERQKSKPVTQSLAVEQLTNQLKRIKETVEVQQAYLQPDLTLERLAQQADLHPKTLSQLINQQFGLNFNDFINQYRVQEAQRRLVSPEYTHLTIEGIAQDVGFNSKTTFNRAFRAFTNMSANEYKKSQQSPITPV